MYPVVELESQLVSLTSAVKPMMMCDDIIEVCRVISNVFVYYSTNVNLHVLSTSLTAVAGMFYHTDHRGRYVLSTSLTTVAGMFYHTGNVHQTPTFCEENVKFSLVWQHGTV